MKRSFARFGSAKPTAACPNSRRGTGCSTSWVDSPHKTVTTAYHLCWTTALLAVVGFGGSASVLVCQQCYVALRSLNENASGGYDSLITVGLLLIALGRPTTTWSLDCRLLRGTWTSRVLVPAWPRALVVFQLLLMYTLTGLQKVGHSWTPFGGYTAMHYVLNDPTWLRGDLAGLPWTLDFVARVGTFVTWHWEQLSCLLLFHWYYRFGNTEATHWVAKVFRRWDVRAPWALTGALMHLGILVLLDVGPFSLVSLAYYVRLWSPAALERTFSALVSRVRSAASRRQVNNGNYCLVRTNDAYSGRKPVKRCLRSSSAGSSYGNA